MQTDTKRIFVLFWLTTSHCFDVDVSCNVRCWFPTQSNDKFSTDLNCCYYEGEIDGKTGVPPPAPTLLPVNLYVDVETNKIAFNITWVDNFSLNESSDGYLLQVSRLQSHFKDSISFQISNKNLPRYQNKPIFLNYKKYGLNSKEEVIDPGFTYSIEIYGLPRIGGYIAEQWRVTNVDIPGCGKESKFSQSENCAQIRALQEITDYTDEEMPTMEREYQLYEKDAGTQENKSIGIQGIYSPFAVIGISVVVVTAAIAGIAYILYFREKWQPQGKNKTSSKILVVCSEPGNDASSFYLEASSQLCCCLRDIGMEVTFNLWNQTSIEATGAIKWVENNVARADCVILINTPGKTDHYSAELVSEEYQLLNPAFDPFKIVRRIIRAGACKSDKFAAVYFGQRDESELCLFETKIFQIPEEFSKLLEHITGNSKYVSFR